MKVKVIKVNENDPNHISHKVFQKVIDVQFCGTLNRHFVFEYDYKTELIEQTYCVNCEVMEDKQLELFPNLGPSKDNPPNQNINARIFDSGAKRDSDNDKPYVHNILGYTRLRYGYHSNLGAAKYGDGNFKLGFPKESAIQSLDRHLAKYMDGDRSEDHLSAIIFNTQLIMLAEQKEGIKVDHYFNKNK